MALFEIIVNPFSSPILIGSGLEADGTATGDFSRGPGTGEKLSIEDEGGNERFTAPFSPKVIEYGGLAPTYSDGDRPGRAPLLLRASEPRPTLSFELFVGSTDDQRSVEAGLATLEHIAASSARVRLHYGPREEKGLWRITSLSYSSAERNGDTNEITRATVSVELTRAVDVTINKGPVAGSRAVTQTASQKLYASAMSQRDVIGGKLVSANARARPGAKRLQEDQFPAKSPTGAQAIDFRSPAGPTGPTIMIYADGYVRDSLGFQPYVRPKNAAALATAKKLGTTKVHIYAKGETLASISNRYYGNPNGWPYIADMNHIRNAKAIKPGTRITIYPRPV
ncbi:MAG: hypothetical protein JWM31_288 [Solirubrobacterales bacterium]|nr:hypothetical protein [Solirubrobacterales bacterium]